MAKYKTTEPHLDCPRCETRFTLREAHRQLSSKYNARTMESTVGENLFCPNCNSRFYRLPSTDIEPLYEVTWVDVSVHVEQQTYTHRHPTVVAMQDPIVVTNE